MFYVGLWFDLSPYRGGANGVSQTPPDKLEWWLEVLGIYSKPLFFDALRAVRCLDVGLIRGQNRFHRQQRRISAAKKPGTGPELSPAVRDVERDAIRAFERGEVYSGPDVIGKPFIPRRRRR